MRRQKQRPIHYSAITLFDGTVLSAHPIRKPTPKSIKQDKIKIDEDWVCNKGWYTNGKQFSDTNFENRFRFQDLMANRINMRRAIRDMVFPYLTKLQNDMDDIHSKLDQIQQMLA